MTIIDDIKIKLDKNELIKDLIKHEIKFKDNRCDYSTQLNFEHLLIPFFTEEFGSNFKEYISCLFKEDILNICEDREEDLAYFLNCIEEASFNKLNCDSCKNKSTCDTKFSPNTVLKTRLLILNFILKEDKFKNGIPDKVKSFVIGLKSLASKSELKSSLCNDFISKYIDNNEWNINIAKLMLDIDLFNENDFKIVKDYYNQQCNLANASSKDYSDIISDSPVLKELHRMIGLNNVKEQIEELYDLLCFRKLTEDELLLPEMGLNCTFEGNPGTGKTKTAKLYAKLLYQTGFIKTDKLMCVSASDLIAEHVGGTAIKTTKVVKESLGGVLFIDEAYQLVPSSEKDFGKECIATLVREMTEHKNNLVIIFAGYKKEMEDFINVNPGMKSRITNRVVFDDYSIDELYQIFKLNSDESKFNLSNDVEPILKAIFKEKSKDKSFGNARFVENLFQEVVIKHSRNTMRKIRNKEIEVNSKDVKTIDINDIPHNYKLHTKKELVLDNINKKDDLSNAI